MAFVWLCFQCNGDSLHKLAQSDNVPIGNHRLTCAIRYGAGVDDTPRHDLTEWWNKTSTCQDEHDTRCYQKHYHSSTLSRFTGSNDHSDVPKYGKSKMPSGKALLVSVNGASLL